LPPQDEEPRPGDKELSNPLHQGECDCKIGRETEETAGKDEADFLDAEGAGKERRSRRS
jgi:hypothetical protein